MNGVRKPVGIEDNWKLRRKREQQASVTLSEGGQ